MAAGFPEKTAGKLAFFFFFSSRRIPNRSSTGGLVSDPNLHGRLHNEVTRKFPISLSRWRVTFDPWHSCTGH